MWSVPKLANTSNPHIRRHLPLYYRNLVVIIKNIQESATVIECKYLELTCNNANNNQSRYYSLAESHASLSKIE